MRSRTTTLFATLAAGAALTACGGEEGAPQAGEAAPGCPVAGEISVGDAWVRAVPDADAMSAAFFTICNGRDTDTAIVEIGTPASRVVELHETTRNAEGVVSMTPVDRFVLPAGAPVALEPGGKHAMLVALTGPIAPGAETPFTIRFADGTSVDVTAIAKDPADAAAMGRE